MRRSAEDQELIRLRLLEAAVDVITEKGFRTATMREIARKAGVGESTIYNYFPTKERIAYGWCAEVQRRVIARLKALPDFHELRLREQIQQLIETELECWLGSREFMREVFAITWHSPFGASAYLTETRELLDSIVIELIDAAIEAGEIPDQPFRDVMPRLFWDYLTGIFVYWLADDTDRFDNTTRLVDQTSTIIADVLQTALIGKLTDTALFLLRTQVLRHFGEMAEAGQNVYEKAMKVKRRFMGGGNA